MPHSHAGYEGVTPQELDLFATISDKPLEVVAMLGVAAEEMANHPCRSEAQLGWLAVHGTILSRYLALLDEQPLADMTGGDEPEIFPLEW